MPSATASRLFALALLVACGGRKETTDSPADVAERPPLESYCESGRYELTVTDSGVVVVPDLGLGPARLLWEGDLNADGRRDVLLRFGDACSGYGDCPHAVLAGCEAGGLGVVWEPEYAVDLKLADAGGLSHWIPLVELRREGDLTRERVLRFTGSGYVASAATDLD